MYTEFFKLREPPFSLTPDPRYLFMSERHREGLAHLLYGVRQPGGFVQLTGEVGSGKTTLCRCLISQLPHDIDVALVLNPRLTVIELLEAVCDELRIEYPQRSGSNKILIDALNRRLLENHAGGRRTVLIIDEAQNLSAEVLEQVRLLTNLETYREKLLQIILIGQPELLAMLKSRKLRQLSQRITARYHLQPMSGVETRAYIRHRLLIAGRREPLFTGSAMRRVCRLSKGVPRAVNIICDRALLGAYASDRQRVTAGIVNRAGREIKGPDISLRRRRVAWIFGAVMLAVILAGGVFLYHSAERPVAGGGATSDSPLYPDGPVTPLLTSAAAGPAQDQVSVTSSHDVAEPQRQTSADLLSMISDPSVTTAAGFSAIYRLWGFDISLKSSDLGCRAGNAEGFECLFQSGNWPRLRRYDLPALLELVLPDGTRKHVALSALEEEKATLVIGNREHVFPVMEINRIWEGSFILLWKPPFTPRQLARGSRGEDVKWVRQVLDQMEGMSYENVSDLFDESLRQRVMAFQRRNSLIPDGLVGSETMVRMIKTMDERSVPSLAHRDYGSRS
ncbi:MAG TPA: AAA family ATPase [Acidobacteriota bacterium]|nr:AAA family ATPase [Acidobacteriota bacterium]